MVKNLQDNDFKNIIFRVNKYHRSNKDFKSKIAEESGSMYFSGFQNILDNQVFYIELDGETKKLGNDEISGSVKIILLDTFNLNDDPCVKCGLSYSKPVGGDQLLPECSFCTLTSQFFFEKGKYKIIVDMDLVGEEKADGDAYIKWIYTYDETNLELPEGYIKGLSKLLKTRADSDLLKLLRREQKQYTDEELLALNDKQLMQIVYHHNSSALRAKAISHIQSTSILYRIFHATRYNKEEIIKRFFELGGHPMAFLTFQLPPFISTGNSWIDSGYNDFKNQVEKEMQKQESKYPYFVETSRKLSKKMSDRETAEEMFLDETVPSSMDLEILREEAMLGNVEALMELNTKKQEKIIAEILIHEQAQIPYDMRFMLLLQNIPETSFEFLLDQILEIEGDPPQVTAIPITLALREKTTNQELLNKLYNHPFFIEYKKRQEIEKERRKFNYEIGFS